MKHYIKHFVLPVLACMAVLVLVACSALVATPRPIAEAYQTPIAVYPTQVPPVEQIMTVYNLDLELSVRDIQSATTSVMQSLAYYGGYLANSQSWQENDCLVAYMVLVVPRDQIAGFQNAVIQLGDPLKVNDSTQVTSCQYCQAYARVNLTLRSRSIFVSMPPVVSGWHPLATLHSASRVFVTIFSFLVDIAIWVVVVAGPFVLLGFIALRVVKRWQHRSTSSKTSGEPAASEQHRSDGE